MGSIIKLTVELTGRMALLEERMTIRDQDQEELNKMKVENCKDGPEEKVTASELKQGNLLSNERNVDVGANAGGSLHAPNRRKAKTTIRDQFLRQKCPFLMGVPVGSHIYSSLKQFYRCTTAQVIS